jgi:hypothetical protein
MKAIAKITGHSAGLVKRNDRSFAVDSQIWYSFVAAQLSFEHSSLSVHCLASRRGG